MKSIVTSAELPATAERVWSVLEDLPNWKRWNRVIPGIQGRAEKGAKLTFWIHIGGVPPLYIAAKVTRCEPGKVLAWGGGVPGLVTGEHYFRLEPTEKGCRLSHGEDFWGALADRLFTRGLVSRVERSYASFNEQLREHLERG